jgi:hypothetical protein
MAHYIVSRSEPDTPELIMLRPTITKELVSRFLVKAENIAFIKSPEDKMYIKDMYVFFCGWVSNVYGKIKIPTHLEFTEYVSTVSKADEIYVTGYKSVQKSIIFD